MNTITKDFNGLPIVFREDGYINATDAAKKLGKDIKEFFKNKGTKEYIKAMEVMGGIPPITLKQAKKGYHANPDVGTYLHPKLAVFFARWLDVRFAVWCDLMIDNILHGNIQTQVVVPTVEAIEVQAAAEKLKARVLELEDEVKRLQEEGFTGDVPDGWQTAGCYLEDRGVPPKHIKAYAMELGTLAANEMTRKRIAAATIASKKGTVEKDKTYYPQDVLTAAYQKLKDAQMGLFAGLLP